MPEIPEPETVASPNKRQTYYAYYDAEGMHVLGTVDPPFYIKHLIFAKLQGGMRAGYAYYFNTSEDAKRAYRKASQERITVVLAADGGVA